MPDISRLTARRHDLDIFRAVAIICVVAAHATVTTGQAEQIGAPSTLFANIFRGGTFLFMFLSGYFFQAVYFYRGFGKFLSAKLRFVALPFLAFSTLFFAMRAAKLLRTGHAEGESLAAGLQDLAANIYLHGGAQPPYWYIYCLFLCFFASFLLFPFVKLPVRVQAGIAAVLLLTAATLTRPLSNTELLWSFVYYMPFYVAGFLYARHEPWITPHLGRIVMLAAPVALAALVWQTWIEPHYGFYRAATPGLNGPDILLIQKTAVIFCLFLACGFLARSDRLHRALHVVAEYSFSIFFMHYFILMQLSGRFPGALATRLGPDLTCMLIVAVTIALCIGLTTAGRAVLGRNSRMLIGT